MVCFHVCVFAYGLCTYVFACMHVDPSQLGLNDVVCMCTCFHVCMFAYGLCTYVFACMHVDPSQLGLNDVVCMCTCLHVCMCTYLQVCMYTHSHVCFCVPISTTVVSIEPHEWCLNCTPCCFFSRSACGATRLTCP